MSKKERNCLSEALSKGQSGGSSDSSPMESTRDYTKIIDSCNDLQVGSSFLPRKVVGGPRHENVRGTTGMRLRALMVPLRKPRKCRVRGVYVL